MKMEMKSDIAFAAVALADDAICDAVVRAAVRSRRATAPTAHNRGAATGAPSPPPESSAEDIRESSPEADPCAAKACALEAGAATGWATTDSAADGRVSDGPAGPDEVASAMAVTALRWVSGIGLIDFVTALVAAACAGMPRGVEPR